MDFVEEPVNVVIVSSATDRFHSNAAMVPGNPKALNAAEIASTSMRNCETPEVTFHALLTLDETRQLEVVRA